MDVEYELSVKLVERNVLETELAAEELWESEEYHRVERQIVELRSELEGEESRFEFDDEQTNSSNQ